MAVTTTTTQTDRILAEIIEQVALPGSYPEIVLAKHVNVDPDLIGKPASAKSYPRLADDGAAGTATEGTEVTTVTTASMGTQLVLTPTEAAAIRFDLTDQTARKRAPGLATVHEAIDSLDIPRLLEIFGEEVMRQRKACMEKLEVDLWALTDDHSTSVGTSGQDVTLAVVRSAILAMTNKEIGRFIDWALALAPVHVDDLVAEIAITGGGKGGAVWSTDIQSIVAARPGMSTDGLLAAVFGIPVIQGSTSVNPSPNGGADEAGVLFVRGVGHPRGPRPGTYVQLIGNDIHTRFEGSITKRETKIVTIWEYAAGERADDMGITVIGDA